MKQIKDIGFVLTGQTGDLAPADGKLYALRDVTGTVPSLPLIASSIMSKKIAAGAQKIVLDVKTGVGAFMQTIEDARALGKMMVEIADLAGRKAVALISDMNQPLGSAVGNALEVSEAVEALHGGGPVGLREHVIEVSAWMLLLGEKAGDMDEARQMSVDVLDDGRAWEKFRELVTAQGGDVSYIDEPDKLPKAKFIETVTMPKEAYISGIHARIVGETCVMLGGGRMKKGDEIDPAVGIEVYHHVGDLVGAGEKLYTIHANDEGKMAEARKALDEAVTFSEEKVEPLPWFYEVVQ
jgi:pyrimidine-nucleoside phosphorylase